MMKNEASKISAMFVWVVVATAIFLSATSCSNRNRNTSENQQQDNEMKRVQSALIVFFESCPAWEETERNLKAAFVELGIQQEVSRREIAEDTDEPTTGSPSVLINGQDLFGMEPSVGNCCRMYATGPAPTQPEVVERLELFLQE